MVANVKQYAVLGIQYAFWGTKVNGYLNGTTTTALANGSSSGMGRLKGVTGISLAEPTAEPIVYLGNNAVVGQFLSQPQTLPNGSMTFSVFDATFTSVSNGVTIYTQGDYDQVGGFPLCFTYADLAFVLNAPAQSQSSGSVGTGGWDVTEIYVANNQASVTTAVATNAVAEFNNQMIINRADKNLEGTALSVANQGSTNFAFNRYWSPYPVTYHKLVGNNVLTTVTLDETPIAANGTAVRVAEDGVAQVYTTDYTVNTSTKVVTFVSAPAAATINMIRYQFVPTC